MKNIKQFSNKASEFKDVINNLKLNIDDMGVFTSGEDLLALYDCLDALERGDLSDDCFKRFQQIEGSQNCWRLIKEKLIAAELLSHKDDQQ